MSFCRRLFLSLFVVVCLIPGLGYGAENNAGAGGIRVGTYLGTVQTPNAVVMVITGVEGRKFIGSLSLSVGDRLCRDKPQPFIGSVEENGELIVDSTKEILRGCERTMRLRPDGNGYKGKFNGPRGEFDIVFNLKGE